MLLNRHFAFRLFPAMAGVFLCACAFAQIQQPTPDNPYPMPPMTMEGGQPPATNPNAAPTPEPAPEPAPEPEARPAYRRPAAPPPSNAAAPPSRPAAPAAKPSPSVPAHPNPAPARPVPFSILNTPAEPARVILASGKLTIEATNSSLSSILSQIARAGGMKISGPYPNSGQRVFGKYGPGAPRAVLSDLLTGSGYNIMMLGITPAGTPRELSLSARAGGLPHPPPQSAQPNQDVDTGDESQTPEQMDDQGPQDEESQPQEEVPPQEEPQTPPNSQNRPRTPEQILQELQRMHQQQQQPPQ